jgi:hypothetical protein
MKTWICINCGHLVITKEKLKPIVRHEFNHFIYNPSKEKFDSLTKLMKMIIPTKVTL